MLIKCISNKGTYFDSIHRMNDCDEECCVLPFTVGRFYDAEEVFHQGKSIYYHILDDDGEYHNYDKHSFIELDELRNNKLEELGL